MIPRPIKLTETDTTRFWSKINKHGLNDCWEWLSYKIRDYGGFCINKSTYLAHRVAFVITNGDTKLQVCYTCNNPSCCDPNHLYAGTQKDNVQQCCAEGRHRNGRGGITKSEVYEIRVLRANGWLQREIADLQVQREQGQFLPDIRLEGMVIKRRAEFPSSTLGSIAINANWTLFDGFRRSAQVAEARSLLREVELGLALLREQVELQIRTAYLDIDTQAASVEMLEEQVDFARTNADSTQRAYRVGEATDLDILASNQTLIRSERQLALATYQFELAIHELERATGTFARETISDFSGGEK